MKTIISLIISLFLMSSAMSQTATKPCTSPAAAQFDFWIGNWNLTWSDTIHGTNHIMKIMGGCTVNENFDAPSLKYKGASWSVYDPNANTWQQTWVDDAGGYISLTGKFENNEMTLYTVPKKLPNGDLITYRMVFTDISYQKFTWRWESSTNGSNSWKINWLIHYNRIS